jgi:outer membrane lipoprotein carrier protein
MSSMWTFYQRLVCAAFLLVAALASANAQAQAQPEPLQLLGDFIRTVQSGRAQFTQTVISPAREGQSVRSRNSSGVFEFARPNKFRFSYSKPYVQTLVADGQTLWLHDPDLNQVTARKLSQVLQGTPAVVIASATDLRGLQADFELSAQAPTGGLQWVQATPRSREGQLQSMRIGLRAGPQGAELVSLEILDALGQRSLMQFSRFETPLPAGAAAFQFTPPPGSDVIRP